MMPNSPKGSSLDEGKTIAQFSGMDRTMKVHVQIQPATIRRSAKSYGWRSVMMIIGT
jgi:hypothetical protein